MHFKVRVTGEKIYYSSITYVYQGFFLHKEQLNQRINCTKELLFGKHLLVFCLLHQKIALFQFRK